MPLTATLVSRAMLALLTGSTHSVKIAEVLARLDVALKQPHALDWIDGWVKLVAAVFPMARSATGSNRIRILPMLALALVARERYQEAGRVVFPPSCQPLRRLNWNGLVPSHAAKFLPVVVTAAKLRWKMAA